MNKIQSIYQIFDRSFSEGALKRPLAQKYMEYDVINLNTRYLTSRKEDGTTSALPIPDYIDPYGHLASIQKSKYFYGPDNEVQYFALRESTTSTTINRRVYEFNCVFYNY
jgi:hypothetical protein